MFKVSSLALAIALAAGIANAADAPGPRRGGDLAGWALNFAPGDPAAPPNTGAECAPGNAKREWSALLTQRVGAELNNAYRERLARVPAAQGLEVKAFVNDVAMQVCRVGPGAWKGGFSVRVTWTVRRAGSGRVLYRGSTSGAYAPTTAQTMPAREGLRLAMSEAVLKLMSDRRFVAFAEPAPLTRVAAAD